MAEFKTIGLDNWLCKRLEVLGITNPSNIQREAIPVILSEKKHNVFACSRTGSGKTLAFVLPIIQKMVRDPIPYYACILAPTRELAKQIFDMVQLLTVNSFAVKSMLIIGGQSQEQSNSKGRGSSLTCQDLWTGRPNIVVATPGRLLDHLTQRNFLDITGNVALIKFHMLVLDEADQLISFGNFASQLKEILQFLDGVSEDNRHKRQTLLFSATLNSALEKLQNFISQKEGEAKPVMINLLPTVDEVKVELSTNPNLDQRYVLCPEATKVAYLIECVLDLSFKQMIVFCSTKKEANLIHKVLLSLGFDGPEFNLNPVLLNADMKQALRFAAIDTFASLRSKILVTTDLANRGLDLPTVDLVINFSCPKSAVTYVHRVGRTCRKPDFRLEESRQKRLNDESADEEDDEDNLSKKIRRYREKNPNALRPKTKLETETQPPKQVYLGKSITIVTQYDIELFKSIESYIGIKMDEQSVDEKGVTSIIKQVAIAIKDAEIRIEKEQEMKGFWSKEKSSTSEKRKRQKLQ